MAEFDGDENAVTRLREAAGYGDDLAFTAQSIRDESALTAHRAALVTEYEATGMAVFTSYVGVCSVSCISSPTPQQTLRSVP